MSLKRETILNHAIQSLEMQIGFVTSCIALLMSEANNLDLQIEKLSENRTRLETELKDLKAELKDTI